MEPGTLELQIFVSLIVILGTAFVALVCDYLKGNNESLREHNIELRVRKEESEKHQPLEAVQWLQHLLGATPRNPIRFGGTRPETRRESHPAAARYAAAEARTAAVPQAPVPHRHAAAPNVELPAAAASNTVAATAENQHARPSGFQVTRARRQGEDSMNASTLLETLPKPAWLQKEQEDKAVARAAREREQQEFESLASPSKVAPAPAVAEAVAAPTSGEKRAESIWTYRGLLDRVVAATNGPTTAEEEKLPAAVTEPVAARTEAIVEKIALVEIAAAPSSVVETMTTVAMDVPARPEEDLVETVAPVESVTSTNSLWHRSEPLVETWRIFDRETSVPEVREETVSAAAVDSSTASYLWRPSESVAGAWHTSNRETSVPEVREESVGAGEGSSSTSFLWRQAEPVAEDWHSPSQAASSQGVKDETAALEEAELIISQKRDDAADFFLTSDPSEATETPIERKPAPQLVTMPSIPELRLPPGYHDRAVFTENMHSSNILTGVVAAIGINDYAHHKEKMGAGPMADLMRSVEAMVAGMIRENIDFGCRSNDDEFLLVFPNETGSDAQRRLAAISEKLWNFQLRSLTNFSVFFSWGAVEVQGETLADAAASASERMYQTKRNRKTGPVDTQRRKIAVNH